MKLDAFVCFKLTSVKRTTKAMKVPPVGQQVMASLIHCKLRNYDCIF